MDLSAETAGADAAAEGLVLFCGVVVRVIVVRS